MLPEELLWVVAFNDILTYRAMVTSLPVLARKITLGTQCAHKIHFGYDVKVENVVFGYEHFITWRLNGKLHRTDGPAMEFEDGDKYYYQDDQRHRTDGPAVEYATGRKAYYINDVGYTPQDYHLMIFQL